MGSLDQVLSGVQQAAQALPASMPKPAEVAPSVKPEVSGFQDVLGGVKAQAAGQMPAITTDEDSVTRSMLQKQARMSDAHQTLLDNSATRILAAGGQGIADVGRAIIQQQPFGSEEEIYKSVPINGEDSWLKSMGKDVVREAIRTGGYAGGVANMLMNVFAGGIPLGATQQMLQQTGKETSSDIPEAMAAGLSDPAMLAILHQMQVMPVHDIVTKPPLPHEIYKAIDNGIIEPSDPAMKAEAAQYMNAQAVALYAEQEALHEPAPLPVSKEPVVVPPTAHDIARQDNPQLFSEYDSLTPRRDFYTGIFNSLLEKRRDAAETSAPHNDEIADLQAKVEEANPRKAKIYQERIDELKEKNQDYVDEQMQPVNFDEDLKNVRSKLSEASIRLGQLEPDVRNALSEASQKVPVAEEPPPAAQPTAKEFEPTEGHFGEFQEEAGAPSVETPVVVTDKIAETISKSLQDAGRPKEEADAGAQIAASIYKTMADSYKGRGTAEDWFAREGAAVKMGGAGKTVRGAYKVATDTARAVIRLMKSANASTFIHETGHHFLAILDKYGRQEDAPQRLKEDYGTIRKWFGLKEGADLFEKNEKGKYVYEKQHEQFAKGFENYVREGTAPSRALADVFAKFGKWLKNIYSAALKLDTPINADVRGVFDRLLSSEPEKTTIAPERGGDTMADTHVKEAASTPPEQAAEVRDKVRSEIDEALKDHNQEIYHDIKAAEAEVRAGGIPPETADDTTGGSTSADAAAAERTAESSTVGAGGGESGAESGVKRETGTGGSDKSLGGKTKSLDKLRDKAGNIRTELLTNKEETRAALKELAQKTGLMDHDVTSDAEIKETAQAMGVKAKELNIKKLRQLSVEDNIPLAARIRAGRQMLVDAGDEAMVLSEKVENGTDADLQKFMEAKDRFMMIAETVSGITYEWGLAGRAFRDISGEEAKSAEDMAELFQRVTGTTKDSMRDLAKLVASKKTPGLKGQAAKVIQAAAKPGFWDYFAEFRRCSILSGWVTHSLWLAGTGFNLGYKALILDTLGGLHNEVGKMMGRPDTGSEIFGGFKGIARALQRTPNIISSTGTAAHAGKTVLLPFEGEHDTFLATGGVRKTLNVNVEALRKAVDASFNENDHDDLKSLREKLDTAKAQGDDVRVQALQETLDKKTSDRKAQLTQVIAAEMQNKLKTWADVGNEMHDFATSILSGIETIGKNMVSPAFYKDKPVIGFDREAGSALPNISVKGVTVAPIGSVMRGTSNRIYSTMHTFTREISANIEVVQEARRMAVEEGKKGKDIITRRNELLASPTKELMQRVNKIANKQTLMSNESSFAKAVVRFVADVNRRTGTKIGTVIAPVIGVPAEATAQTVVDSSLFGLASKNKREALFGRQGLLSKEETKALSGELGEETKNQVQAKINARTALEQERAQVKMFAGTALLGLGFWLAEKGITTPSPSVNYKQDQERRDAGKQAGSIGLGDWMVSLAHIPVTGTVLTAGADIHHIMNVALDRDQSDKLKPAIASAVDNFFLHENALVGLSDLIDAMRLKTDPMAYLKNQGDSLVPQFISQTNSVFDPLQRESKNFMSSLISRIPFQSEGLEPKINALNGEPLKREPFHVSSATPDPIAENLMSLRIYPTNPKANINGADLGPRQTAEYSSAKGHILYSGLQMLMQGDGKQDYDAADSDGKRKMVQRIAKHAADCSKSIMFNKYPELLKDANDQHEAECREDVGP